MFLFTLSFTIDTHFLPISNSYSFYLMSLSFSSPLWSLIGSASTVFTIYRVRCHYQLNKKCNCIIKAYYNWIAFGTRASYTCNFQHWYHSNRTTLGQILTKNARTVQTTNDTKTGPNSKYRLEVPVNRIIEELYTLHKNIRRTVIETYTGCGHELYIYHHNQWRAVGW